MYSTVCTLNCKMVWWVLCAEAEFPDEIQTKVLRFFLLAIYSHLYIFAFWFLFLQTHTTSYIFLQFSYWTLYRRKEENHGIPPSLWFKKSNQKPQVWKLSRLCLQTSTKLYVQWFGFCWLTQPCMSLQHSIFWTTNITYCSVKLRA